MTLSSFINHTTSTNQPITLSNEQLNHNSSYSEDEIAFEIFDPRGLFSPQSINNNNNNNNNNNHQLSSNDTTTNTTTTTTIQPNLTSIPSHWPIHHHPPTSTFNPTQSNKHYLPTNSPSLFASPSSANNPNQLPDPPNSIDVSPVESPVSPCSSLPYCRSPPTSLSMSQSLSLPRGRSPPARFSLDSLSLQLDSPSSSSSPSPSRHSSSVNQSTSTQTRQNAPFFNHPRPTPIVTSGIRDLSLPSRLSHPRFNDPPCSVSSLAYSDMDASPAVNFLSAFADATLPTVKTEMSPVATVPLDALAEGDQVAGYTLGSIIGRGGFSVVRQARHLLTDQCVAVKIVKRSSNPCSDSGAALSRSSTIQPLSLHASISSRDRSSSVALSANRHLVNSTHLPLPTSANEALANAMLKKEIQIWSNLRHHPHIVPLLSLHETSSQTLLFMPMCEGGNLLQLVNQFKLDPIQQSTLYQEFLWTSPDSIPPSPPRPSDPPSGHRGLSLHLVRLIFWQIVQGLKYLHTEAGIVHKDIKLENILIQKGQVKISDFGLATYPFPERPVDVVRSVKGKASSSWNRDLSLPKHFSALPRIIEGLVTVGNPRVASWGPSHPSRPRLPPTLDNSLFLSEPVKEDEDGVSYSLQPLPLDTFPTAAGSLAYTPPEQLRSEIPLACPSLDIWALGCVLYGLLEGNLPFQDDFEPRLRLKIMNGQFEFPQALIVDLDRMSEIEADNRMMIAKVLKGCLAVDRNARWMVEEIAASAWLKPQRCKVSSPRSDDGLSSDGNFDRPSISKRSNSISSSLPSAWSIDEIFSNATNRLPIPDTTPYNEVGSDPEELPVPTPYSDVTCTSPPLIRKNLLDLRKLLTTVPSHSSSSRNSVSVNGQISCRSPQPVELPPSPGLERIARPKHRGVSNRLQSHFRVSLSRVSTNSKQSPSRSRSGNRSPFGPSK